MLTFLGNEKNKRDYITVADLRDDQLKETYSVLNGIRKEMIELSGLLQAQLAITKQKGHFETPDEDLTIRNVELHMG